jgi:hypothetical protein
MNRGGRRIGAGRPAVLSEEEKRRVGQACERVWFWLAARRPYGWRPYVLLSAAVFYSEKLRATVTPRRIEAAWKHSRALGLDRAQPLEKAYEDAKAMEEWLHARLDRQRSDAQNEILERLPPGSYF